MTDKEHLIELADELDRGEGADNALDVQFEVAMMSSTHRVRANSAGTKVIYTDECGCEHTCWADDVTSTAWKRHCATKELRAKAGEV